MDDIGGACLFIHLFPVLMRTRGASATISNCAGGERRINKEKSNTMLITRLFTIQRMSEDI